MRSLSPTTVSARIVPRQFPVLDIFPRQLSAASTMDPWTRRDVSDFIRARSADGGVWEYTGSLVALATGRVLAHVSGVEEVSAHNRGSLRRLPRRKHGGGADARAALAGSPSRPKPASVTHAARIVTRKALFYTVPESGARMNVFRFRPTAPPRPVFPIVTAAVAQDVMLDEMGQLVVVRARPEAEAGADAVGTSETPRLTVKSPPLRLSGKKKKGGMLSAAWTYVGRGTVQKGNPKDNKTPNRPGVVEEYHWVGGRDGGAATWVRIGRCPSWYGGGQCMMNLRSVRVKGGRRGLDGKIKEWLRTVDRGRPLRLQDAEPIPEASREPKKRRKRILGIF